jgi:hypothetical protein
MKMIPLVSPGFDLTGYQIMLLHVQASPSYPLDVTPPWLNFSPIDIGLGGDDLCVAAGVNGVHLFSPY